MFMNAFPALDKLDHMKVSEKTDFYSDPEAFKRYYIKFVQVKNVSQ